jgi:hypothetical protein
VQAGCTPERNNFLRRSVYEAQSVHQV